MVRFDTFHFISLYDERETDREKKWGFLMLFESIYFYMRINVGQKKKFIEL